MASLSIKVREAEIDGARPAGGLVAELSRLDGHRTRDIRRKVSVSGSSGGMVPDLEPGLWQVSIVTPGGRILTKEVEVTEAVPGAALFTLPPHRSRQDTQPISVASGSKGSTERARPARRTRGFSGPPGLPVLARVSVFGLQAKNAGPPRAYASGGPVVRVYAAAPVGEARVEEAVRLWSAVAEALSAGRLPTALWPGQSPKPLAAEGAGRDDARWRLPSTSGRRLWAVVGRRGAERVHSVPMPWRPDSGERQVVLATAGDASRSHIVVEDEAFAGLLAYLASGSVVTAVDLLTADDGLTRFVGGDVQALLYDKRGSPLGACAAAYALVGSTVTGRMETWHSWVSNLSRWYDWLPDGAILEARLALLNARTDADIAAVLPLIHQAINRGLPHYRQGFDWLLQAMLHFAEDDLVAKARPRVADVAAALDMREVFTTLRVGRGTV